MTREFEQLLETYARLCETTTDEAHQASRVFYEARLEELARAHSLTPAALNDYVRRRYPGWLRAQQHPPALPPTA
jgi:hypothetical protein